MGVQEEQERRGELLTWALEACPDPEQALAVAVRMEQFIIDGQTSRKEPHKVTQPGGQPSSEGSRETTNRSCWTGDDDAHLRRLWQSNLAIEAIAQELQRTPASIYARVRNLDLLSKKDDNKNGNGNRKTKPSRPDKQSPNANSKKINGFEDVGIDSVVHFLRTRDYSVVQTKDDCYDLDGRKILTALELFERANKVRVQLGRPTWAALKDAPKIDRPHKEKI